MRADRLFLRIALAVGATLATLVVCEAAARWLLAPPRYHREPVELDPELGFRGIPGFREQLDGESGRFTFELNSDGFRGRELGEGSPPGAARILFVGDSFLVGQALPEPELATSLVEAGLRERSRGALVFNLSTVDFGTAQELLLLRRFGKRLEPEVVVLFAYPANDLINDSMRLANRTTVSAGDPIRPYLVPDGGGGLEVRYLHPLRAALRRHSRLFATLERRVLASRAERPAGDDPVSRLRLGRAPREDLEIFRIHPDPGSPWVQAWETTFGLLRAFRAECDAMGARLLVVVVPSVHQVVRNAKGIRLDVETRIARGQPLDAILDWDLPERRLRAFFDEDGIEASFLLEPLREAAARGDRVYGRDEHLSARGHEIAAGAVLEWLGSEGGLAPSPSTERRGRPVRLLPGGSAARSFLDFAEDRHLDHLGDGWISWTPAGSEAPAGWWIGPSALAALAPGDGDLVLRGWAPSLASYPIDGSVGAIGGDRHRFRIDRPGRFAFRFSASGRRVPAPPTAEGHLAVILALGETPGGGALEAGLVIDALGFETPEPEGAASS